MSMGGKTVSIPLIKDLVWCFGLVLAFCSVVVESSGRNDTATTRKLLLVSHDGKINRIGGGGECSVNNILIQQNPSFKLPSGIPTYTLIVQNVCVSGPCTISNIHLHCKAFSSARTINPNVFKRINYDDCLVNGGRPMHPGQTLSIEYANTFMYPMSVSNVTCN